MSHTYMLNQDIVEESSDNAQNNDVSTQAMPMTHYQLVGEFHDIFDYPVRTSPYSDVFDKEPKLLKSRLAFMREERDEFDEAFQNNDMVEMADALCDLNYFAYGSGQCLGIDLDAEMVEDGCGNIAHTPEDLSTAVDPNMPSLLGNEIKVRLDVISTHIDEFETACGERRMIDMARSLINVVRSTYELGYYLHFDMDRMFREVHRSNMTKACHSEADAQESVRRYLEEGRYKTPVVRTKGSYFLVYDEDLNKILKYYKWEEPNLRQFMGAEYIHECDE
jgi:predicted HAD superfamily Cof-like phosphohydrolase